MKREDDVRLGAVRSAGEPDSSGCPAIFQTKVEQSFVRCTCYAEADSSSSYLETVLLH